MFTVLLLFVTLLHSDNYVCGEHTFKLTKVIRDPDNPYLLKSGSTQIEFNIRQTCHPTFMGCTNTTSTAYLYDGVSCVPLAAIDTETCSVSEDNTTLILNYTHPQRRAGSYAIHIKCAQKQSISYDTSITVYNLYFAHPDLCPGGGLSFGSIALIVIAGLIFLFFTIGPIIMHFGFHKDGIELIPFVHFFIEFGLCVKDGVLVILSPCMTETAPEPYQKF